MSPQYCNKRFLKAFFSFICKIPECFAAIPCPSPFLSRESSKGGGGVSSIPCGYGGGGGVREGEGREEK